jgi:hypothetical protein
MQLLLTILTCSFLCYSYRKDDRKKVGNFEICVLLGYYATLSGKSVPKFRDKASVSSSRVKKSKKTLEDGTDRLSRNVGTELQLSAA